MLHSLSSQFISALVVQKHIISIQIHGFAAHCLMWHKLFLGSPLYQFPSNPVHTLLENHSESQKRTVVISHIPMLASDNHCSNGFPRSWLNICLCHSSEVSWQRYLERVLLFQINKRKNANLSLKAAALIEVETSKRAGGDWFVSCERRWSRQHTAQYHRLWLKRQARANREAQVGQMDENC